MVEVFCSNTKYLEVEAIYFLTLISNLLTLILSNADDFSCNVFCPNATIPSPGKDAIGFIFPSYNVSLSACVHLFNTETAPTIPPRFKPAGANHSAATASFAAKIPGINTDGGTAVNLLVFLSIVLTHG